jgi:hypothetical protein
MRTFRRETALYVLALLLGLAVRLVRLGTLPLTDSEARWALQALGAASGTHPVLGAEPAYVVLTALLFFAYGGATNFLARLVPALAGSALVLVPKLFKDHLKPRPALILAFLLALEPGLVALSRQAGSSIMVLTFVLAAWGLWEGRRLAGAGVFAGLALLSGSAIWAGLLAFALTWAIIRPFERDAKNLPAPGRRASNEWLTALWFALGTMVIGGTLFLLVPSGLSGWLSGLPEYLGGWRRGSDISAGLMLFSLIAYQPLGLVLALVASVRGWIQRSRRVRSLSLWMLVALLLALFYPSHQVTDLAWMLVPLWALASLELARSLNIRREERPEILGVVALSFLILVFVWLDFLGLINSPGPSDESMLRTWLLFGALFLLVVSLLLVAVGWSIRVARYGAIWGLAAALGIYSFAALMSAAGLKQVPDSVDMWRPDGTLPESDLLLTSVQQISDWSKEEINAQPVTLVGIDSPALQWLLHERSVQVRDALGGAVSPPMVITINQDNPTLAATYRGQGFVWRRTPLWNKTIFPDWLRWLSFHQVPQESEMVILWVRGDLFLDSTAPRP